MQQKYILKCFSTVLIAAAVILSGCSSEVQTPSAPSDKPKRTAAPNQPENTPQNNIPISDMNVPISINGTDAKVECYDIDGKIYVRLSDIGNYLDFSPYFEKNTIQIKRSYKTKTYSYYKELTAVPDFETISSTSKIDKLDIPIENYSENAAASFIYLASKEDIEQYKNILRNEGFEHTYTVQTNILDINCDCYVFQSDMKYSVSMSIIYNVSDIPGITVNDLNINNLVGIQLFDSSIGSVLPSDSPEQALPEQAEAAEQTVPASEQPV